MTPAAQAPSGDAAAIATRVLSAGIGDRLQAFRAPGLLARGCVTLISLDPVAETFGSRWTLQAQRVESFVERLFTRELRPGQAFLQVSPTDVLVSLPDCERDTAQVACLGYLRQVLHHFLGSSARAPNALYEVLGIEPDRVEAKPVEASHMLALETAAEVERERSQSLARATEPFIASHGKRVRVACVLEPLLNLATGSTIGVRLAQRVYGGRDDTVLPASAISDFAGVDRQRVDWSVVIHGLAQLRERDAGIPTLILSTSYASLSSQRGRSDMLALLQQARQHASLGVICEVSGVEGAPHAQFQEAVSIIRPMALFVVGKIEAPSQVVWGDLRGSGLRGLAFECPPYEGDAVLQGWVKATAAKARQVATSVLFYGMPSIGFAAALSGAGATHATLAS